MKPQTTQNFNEILKTIQASKQKALQQVNTTLIELYWEIGKYISTKTIHENWGKGIVKELADFIKERDPTLKGFSDKNLWRMKQFYETYNGHSPLKLYETCGKALVQGSLGAKYKFSFRNYTKFWYR